MVVKAKLTITLKANDTVVAEVEDSDLWQQVLTSINTGAKLDIGDAPDASKPEKSEKTHADHGAGSTAISKFAAELGITQAIAKGACSPSDSPPFIHLDKHHWEALKRNTPERGSKAVGAVVLAATLLVLWKEKAGLGATPMKEAAGVLETIGVTAKNPTRSINNCEWLQLRNGTIVLNPAQTSKAISIAKAYCSKESPAE